MDDNEPIITNKNVKVISWIMLGILSVFSIWLIVGTINNARTRAVYDDAEKLIVEEQYAQALELLERIKDSKYQDTESLMLLCEAHMKYAEDEKLYAYRLMSRTSFQYQSEEQRSKISAFRSVLNNYYDTYQEESQKRERQVLENRARNSSVPYVGMSEAYIHKTKLGKASDKVRHNREVKNGLQYEANIYDFYENGRVIFTARCLWGSVAQVWDKRNRSPSTYTSTKKKKQTFSSNDPVVGDFTNPEDFYDWYYDDFFDYEEAEDYYYSHGGE